MIRRTWQEKIMTPLEARQNIKALQEHCEALYKNFGLDGKNYCALCPMEKLCEEQFGQDLPRYWKLPKVPIKTIAIPRD